MEYADGGTVRDELNRAAMKQSGVQEVLVGSASLPGWRMFQILDHIVAALAVVHDKGAVHQDVKPSNCFVCKGGAVKLGDFGLATGLATTTTTDSNDRTCGRTTAYAAPELLWSDSSSSSSSSSGNSDATPARPSSATDIFALGVTAYEIVTGRVPWADLHEGNAVLRVVRGHRPPFPPHTHPFFRYSN